MLHNITDPWNEVLDIKFQWAPTLGGECYLLELLIDAQGPETLFQWAPTLGGECYLRPCADGRNQRLGVSMGTHPWG